MRLELHLTLQSDATFGRGESVPGLADQEVEHDSATGLPFIRGRTLKGLLVEECANLLFALGEPSHPRLEELGEAAAFLFGRPGSTLGDDARMRFGPALLPEELRAAVEADSNRRGFSPAVILESLTAIRRQTAVDEATGAPERGSLRAMRVVLRSTPFVSQLTFEPEPAAASLALPLLAACVLSLRRGGTARNRGRGRLIARLVLPTSDDATATDVTEQYFRRFTEFARAREAAA